MVRKVTATEAKTKLLALLGENLVDRIIYATATENGWQLVTKDRRMRDYPRPRQITVW